MVFSQQLSAKGRCCWRNVDLTVGSVLPQDEAVVELVFGACSSFDVFHNFHTVGVGVGSLQVG